MIKTSSLRLPMSGVSLNKSTRNITVAVLMVTTVLTSCSKGPEIPTPGGEDTTTNPNPQPPVETRTPTANYPPAFSGQTRGPGAKTQTAIKVTEVIKSTQLYKPWSINFIDNEKMLISQKNGYLRIVTTSGQMSNAVKIPNVYFDDNIGGSNAGLFDVVFDPDFANNQLIYYSYVKGNRGANTLAIAKARVSLNFSGPTVSGFQDIYAVTPAITDVNVYGGRLLFDKQGYLMVSTAARLTNESEYQAQNLSSSLGKILRIDKNGNAAPGNPFAGISGALPEIWALGVRSPLGFAYHPVTGELWETEHGPAGGDEVNIIQRGKNYGWPLAF